MIAFYRGLSVCVFPAALLPRRRGMLSSRSHGWLVFTLSLLFTFSLFACPFICPAACAQTASNHAASANASADAPQLKADLQRILSSEEFQPEGKGKNSLTRLVQTLRERWEQLRKWFANLFHTGGLSGGGTALTWTLVTLMACALLWVAYRLLRDLPARRKTAPEAGALRVVEEANSADIIRDPEHWRRVADEHARVGEYRAAYRALFLAVLLRLDQAGILSYDQARTNGDYIRALRAGSQSALYDMLLPPAQDFDRFWYGQVKAGAEDYQTLLNIYERLPVPAVALPAARANNPLPDSRNHTPPTAAQNKGTRTP